MAASSAVLGQEPPKPSSLDLAGCALFVRNADIAHLRFLDTSRGRHWSLEFGLRLRSWRDSTNVDVLVFPAPAPSVPGHAPLWQSRYGAYASLVWRDTLFSSNSGHIRLTLMTQDSLIGEFAFDAWYRTSGRGEWPPKSARRRFSGTFVAPRDSSYERHVYGRPDSGRLPARHRCSAT